ncbi:MAG: EamA family transporter [Chitinophagaceae bacterium]
MDKVSFILLGISIFTHAYWNYLIKASGNKHVFTALSKLVEACILIIPAIYFLNGTDFKPSFLLYITVASVITFSNYFFVANAYRLGTFILTYPISRSSVLFLPVLSYLFIGERIDLTGIIGVFFIVIGTFIMHLDPFTKANLFSIFKTRKNKGTIYALLAAFTAAAYTLWDKVSLSEMKPFLYFSLYTIIIACIYNIYCFTKFPKTKIRAEWIDCKYKIIAVAVLNSFTYMLVLISLTKSKATYVGGMRQLSVVVGAYFGYKFMDEKLGLPKLTGIGISITGACLIYMAR